MHPAYEGKPLIVLSNNDGCAIARTAEAKALGIKMGAPWFEIKHLSHTHGLIALSANFSLYGDLSSRMMNVIAQFSPRQEIYSIDESFLDLTGISGTGRDIAQTIRSRVRQWVGIPTCVGIGSTRTLAKLANLLAKNLTRLEGVCDLSNLDKNSLMRAIRHVPVGEVWGVGRRLNTQLLELGILSAADLAQTDNRVIRDKFSIVLAKTARELVGEQCLDWDETPSKKQQIMCSRSFGNPILDKADLAQAISTFTSKAAEKLRHEQATAQSVLIFIRTSRFSSDARYDKSSITKLLAATDDTQILCNAALSALDRIYQPGFKYTKAGVRFSDIVHPHTPQQKSLAFDSLHSTQNANSELMMTLDKLNQRYGSSTIALASTLSAKDAAWKMRQERMTPAYTTDWNQIIEVWK